MSNFIDKDESVDLDFVNDKRSYFLSLHDNDKISSFISLFKLLVSKYTLKKVIKLDIIFSDGTKIQDFSLQAK